MPKQLLDRSRRPERPKVRATKRRVAAIGFRPDFTVKNLRPLGDDALDKILGTLPDLSDAELERMRRELQDIAGRCLRQREQPEPSRSEASYELAMLAHKTWRLSQSGELDTKTRQRLRRAVNGLNSFATNYLWKGLEKHPRFAGQEFFFYLLSDAADWELIGEAAAIGWTYMTGGDVADRKHLSLALQEIVELYELVLQKPATHSTSAVGPTSVRGTCRLIGDSEVFRFAVAFFKEVDTEVSELWLSGKLRKFLEMREKCLPTGNMDNLSHQ